MKTAVHYIDNYLLQPTHPVTVNLIGCGGTGSHLLTHLLRIHQTLVNREDMDHPGLHIRAYDPDIVAPSNLGRQLFYPSDLGQYKANVLISRINRSLGTAWEAIPEYCDGNVTGNFTITCVDTVKARLIIGKGLAGRNKNRYSRDHKENLYWMDIGNTRKSGQVILGSLQQIPQADSKKYDPVDKLPCITELFDLKVVDEKENGPSCSTVAALRQQSLFINSMLAEWAGNLLWDLFNDKVVSYHGLFLNLEKLSVNPLPITKEG